MLDEILNPPEYPRGKRLFIVDMMKKFELCYDMESDTTFLVPDLLPKDEPVTIGHENTLAFQYHYTVLPSSVITRLIVRMNEFIQEQVWRSGVVLKDSGSTALVKADTEDRKVFIWVGGDEHKRHDFLSKIRGQFDAIHKTISKLEVKEMVPVPDHPEAEPVDYDLLLQMEHNHVEGYPVLSGGKMIVVNVREMLNGVARQEDRQRGNVNVYIGGNLDGNMIIGDENVSNKS
jgi:internalin A